MSGSGRSLAEPAFPDDDGTAYPALEAALGDRTDVLGVLGGVRVFVPIVATIGGGAGPRAVEGTGEGGLTAEGADKDADMAAVLMTGADGRQALLTFSSLATMAAWNAEARPVPVWGQAAAVAALAEGASAVLLDLGSPHFTVVEADDLQHLANGDRLARTDAGTAWVRSG
ncbi:SseB family protein [Aeromicrobium sp. CF4.19]|uniref:SseB family protein n=1 Tax=Aeromicrobium sp. CF4.19 TaxID=3373082 RepID=UPI003EE71011